jgi:hypothetical protein
MPTFADAAGEQPYEVMLTGGHPNSLGRTLEVVDHVLADRRRLRALLDCYDSDDAVVRLRTSSAIKRVSKERHQWLVEYLDELIDNIGALNQASAQWTLAELFLSYTDDMSTYQYERAVVVMKRNIKHHDWIVLNQTLETLAEWSRSDAKLRRWLRPHLDRLVDDPRKSVASRALKKRKILFEA